jgi:diacylglycerol kinase (ATP)
VNDVARQGSFAKSVRHAWHGLVHTVAHQRNMRVHLISAFLVMLVGSGIPLGLAEKVTLIFCVQLVFFAEILNSALEALVDLATEQLHDNARITKDAAAAAVLVLTIGTVVIFAALLVHDWSTVVSHGAAVLRQALLGVPLALCGAALLRTDHRRAWLDVVLLGIAVALWALTLVRTESWVFSALLLGLVVLAFASARAMTRGGRIAG